MTEREVLLRICEAYGGNPDDPAWHSVEGVAGIIEELSGQVRAIVAKAWGEKMEMLDALRGLVGDDNPPAGEPAHIDYADAVRAARAAIAKAEGAAQGIGQ